MWDRIRKKIASWQNPPASTDELILDRHRVYIFPNRAGFVYAALLLAIFITSINYNLNLGFALVFVLVSCGWLGINFTFRNMSGMGLIAGAGQAVFAGDTARFSVVLNNYGDRPRHAIHVGFSKDTLQPVDIAAHSNTTITLDTPARQRGRMACPRVRIQSTFPIGLLTAWSYWTTARTVLVYPRPEPAPPPLPYSADGQAGLRATAGIDEFSGVRNYQAGDPLKHLAWRQIARQSTDDHQVLLTKHFEGGTQQHCVLDFDDLPAQLGLEQKLSRLCAWLLEAEARHVRYAFRIGSVRYPVNAGEEHLYACLGVLATFGEAP